MAPETTEERQVRLKTYYNVLKIDTRYPLSDNSRKILTTLLNKKHSNYGEDIWPRVKDGEAPRLTRPLPIPEAELEKNLEEMNSDLKRHSGGKIVEYDPRTLYFCYDPTYKEPQKKEIPRTTQIKKAPWYSSFLFWQKK